MLPLCGYNPKKTKGNKPYFLRVYHKKRKKANQNNTPAADFSPIWPPTGMKSYKNQLLKRIGHSFRRQTTRGKGTLRALFLLNQIGREDRGGFCPLSPARRATPSEMRLLILFSRGFPAPQMALGEVDFQHAVHFFRQPFVQRKEPLGQIFMHGGFGKVKDLRRAAHRSPVSNSQFASS